jgi:hypothetical protein
VEQAFALAHHVQFFNNGQCEGELHGAKFPRNVMRRDDMSMLFFVTAVGRAGNAPS